MTTTFSSGWCLSVMSVQSVGSVFWLLPLLLATRTDGAAASPTAGTRSERIAPTTPINQKAITTTFSSGWCLSVMSVQSVGSVFWLLRLLLATRTDGAAGSLTAGTRSERIAPTTRINQKAMTTSFKSGFCVSVMLVKTNERMRYRLRRRSVTTIKWSAVRADVSCEIPSVAANLGVRSRLEKAKPPVRSNTASL